jgi:uncharacterized protein YbaP (TraB family)
MRRLIIVIFLCLSGLALPAAWSAERGALFKVSASGHTLYLFGTMHVGLPEFYPLEPRIAGALAGASTLALEIDPEQTGAAMAEALASHGLFAPGSAGNGAMPPALRARLGPVLEQAHIDPAAVASFKPWLLATVLALAEYASLGYRTDLAVDAYLARLARAGKVRVIELESVDAQLALFDRLPEAAQWRFLDESVGLIESGKQRAQVREVVEAWRSADRAGLDAIAERAQQDDTLSGRFVQQVMLDERNGPLADKLAQLLASENNTMAAIGVLHLVGKHGVPVLLRARGLTVERVY